MAEATILLCGLDQEKVEQIKSIIPEGVKSDVIPSLFEKIRPRPFADYDFVLYNADRDVDDRFYRNCCPSCKKYVMVTENRGQDLLNKSMEANCLGVLEWPINKEYASQLLFSKIIRSKKDGSKYIFAKD